jgi:hypothetical protein
VNAQLVAALRSGAQLLMSWLVTHVAVFALLPDGARGAIVEGVVSAVILAVWVYGVRWLETRVGDGPGPTLARMFGRILMLGIVKQPVYADPDPMRSPSYVAYSTGRRTYDPGPAGAAITDVVPAVPE